MNMKDLMNLPVKKENQYFRIKDAILDITDTDFGIDFELLNKAVYNQRGISPEIYRQNDWLVENAPFYYLAATHINNMLFHTKTRTRKNAMFHAERWTKMTSDTLCQQYHSDHFDKIADFIIEHSRIADRYRSRPFSI